MVNDSLSNAAIAAVNYKLTVLRAGHFACYVDSLPLCFMHRCGPERVFSSHDPNIVSQDDVNVC
jgi:hypothetical protein